MLPVMLMGPTAAGKSALAVRLAHALDGEILNADAMQVYHGLDIGTGKLPPGERRGIPHHLLDLLNAHGVFSAGEFRRLTLACLDDVRLRGRRSILVGGTGFYLKALAKTLAPMPDVPPTTRVALNGLLDRHGSTAMHRMLKVLDPDAAERIAPGDRQRIERALEVILVSGRPFSAFHGGELSGGDRQPFLKIGLFLPRPLLRERIHERVIQMVKGGWVEEVRRLLELGVDPECHAFKSIGYRELAEVVRGRIPVEEAVERTVVRTHQFAKRQMTWFRREEGIFWVDASVADIAFQQTLGYITLRDKENNI